jgi:hypothetical protein
MGFADPSGLDRNDSMSSYSRTLTRQQPTSGVRAASGSALVVPFGNRGHRLAKIGPAPLTSEWSTARAAIRPVPGATEESAADLSTTTGVVIDFAQARRSGGAAPIREGSSNEGRNSPALADLAVIVYVAMATAFYPALAWFLTRA